MENLVWSFWFITFSTLERCFQINSTKSHESFITVFIRSRNVEIPSPFQCYPLHSIYFFPLCATIYISLVFNIFHTVKMLPFIITQETTEEVRRNTHTSDSETRSIQAKIKSGKMRAWSVSLHKYYIFVCSVIKANASKPWQDSVCRWIYRICCFIRVGEEMYVEVAYSDSHMLE